MKRFLNVRTLAFPLAAAAAIILATVLRPGDPAAVSELARIDPVAWEPPPASDMTVLYLSGVERYSKGDFEGAIPELTAALSALSYGDAAQEVRLYLGICYLQTGQPAEAVAPLREAAGAISRPLVERAVWYRAQAHLLLGETAEARALLNELSRISAAYARPASEQLLALRGK